MLAELVRVEAADGVALHGALTRPKSTGRTAALDVPETAHSGSGPAASGPAASGPAESVVLCLHGVASNFYSSGLFHGLAARLRDAGYWVLRANTRGHDAVYTGMGANGPRRLGAAYERVDESRYDLRAWIEWLVGRGRWRRVFVCGHSLGAIKGIYALAHEPSLLGQVQGLVAMSAPRLSAQAFQLGETSGRYRATLSEAQQQVKAGRPDALIESQFPFPMLITAQGYLDKYGGENYNILGCADRLTCPTLFTYGERELEHGGVSFAGVPAALETLGTRRAVAAAWDVACVPGADHMYSGKLSELGDTVLAWLTARWADRALG